MREYWIRRCLKRIEKMAVEQGADVRLDFEAMTEEKAAELTETEKAIHRLVPGDEFVLVWSGTDGTLLYAVNVSCDSTLTVCAEVMQLLAKKF